MAGRSIFQQGIKSHKKGLRPDDADVILFLYVCYTGKAVRLQELIIFMKDMNTFHETKIPASTITGSMPYVAGGVTPPLQIKISTSF